MEGDRISII